MLPKSGRLIVSAGLGLALLAAGCAAAPYTGRRQFLMVPEGSETSMGLQAFQEIKRRYRPCRDPEITAMVSRVGQRIAAAAHRPDYRWEFLVFQDDKMANAFCLPGGKVGIFTGILKYTRDEAGLATVMAHEAAHAIARHAGERLSQSLLAQAGGLGLGLALGGLNPYAGKAIMTGYDLGTQVGILLPYSRSQEYEADKIGLVLMAKAGYDPALALDFWQRMMTDKEREKGQNLPQFLSTHPKDDKRMQEMAEFLPQARKYYVSASEAASVPPEPAKMQPPPAPGQWVPCKK